MFSSKFLNIDKCGRLYLQLSKVYLCTDSVIFFSDSDKCWVIHYNTSCFSIQVGRWSFSFCVLFYCSSMFLRIYDVQFDVIPNMYELFFSVCLVINSQGKLSSWKRQSYKNWFPGKVRHLQELPCYDWVF